MLRTPARRHHPRFVELAFQRFYAGRPRSVWTSNRRARHWTASDAGNFTIEHDIYHDDAVLDCPQSSERIRGRSHIREGRYLQQDRKRFTVRRSTGHRDLWITEFTLAYDGKPSSSVSIMEFRDGLVAHETQYFADPFEPNPSRAHLVKLVSPAA